MLKGPNRDQVTAFAGLMQSAMLVYQLATRDDYDEDALLVSALSVLRTDADAVSTIYGSPEDLRLGFSAVAKLLGGRAGQSSRALFQYAVAMHQVSRRLNQSTHMAAQIHRGLAELSARHMKQDLLMDASDASVDRLYEDLASLYTGTISTLTPRIMVQGSQGRLSSPLVVSRVRSALFAGIRAAFLWHQLGGRRWHLLFQRRHYQSMAQLMAG